MTPCAADGCPRNAAYGRLGMCRYHYNEDLARRHETGELANVPPVCVCEDPEPDGLGQCARCGRLVVTYVHSRPLQDVYARAWPVEWARAVRLHLHPWVAS